MRNGDGLIKRAGATERDRRVVVLAQELFLRRAADLKLDVVGRDNYDSLVDEATHALMGADAFLHAARGWVEERGAPKKRARPKRGAKLPTKGTK